MTRLCIVLDIQFNEDAGRTAPLVTMRSGQNGRDLHHMNSSKRDERISFRRSLEKSPNFAFLTLRSEPRPSEECPTPNTVPELLAQVRRNVFHNFLQRSGNASIRRLRDRCVDSISCSSRSVCSFGFRGDNRIGGAGEPSELVRQPVRRRVGKLVAETDCV
jgi:hypothetical protein